MIVSSVIAWVLANPFYDFAILIGFALGIFYGFDGWRGSIVDVDFQDSPRVKNLIWLLTGALTTVFGDVKAIDPYIEKRFLIADYAAGVLVGALITIIPWGVMVFIDSVQSSHRLGSSYSPLDAVGDYFFHGYRRYRERKEEFAASARSKFTRNYLEQLSYSIAVASSKMSPDERLTTTKNLLRTVTALVQMYRGPGTEGIIRTNLMLVRPCEAALRKRLSFCAVPAEVEMCLELVACDKDGLHQPLVLPLPSVVGGPALPGAPKAVDTESTICDDTRQIEFDELIPKEIQMASRGYFRSKESLLRSFASLRIVAGGHPIGVMNVDCSDVNVFGKETNDKQTLTAFLLPFCSVFGILYNERQELQHESPL